MKNMRLCLHIIASKTAKCCNFGFVKRGINDELPLAMNKAIE